jgi:hypothetical protein
MLIVAKSIAAVMMQVDRVVLTPVQTECDRGTTVNCCSVYCTEVWTMHIGVFAERHLK